MIGLGGGASSAICFWLTTVVGDTPKQEEDSTSQTPLSSLLPDLSNKAELAKFKTEQYSKRLEIRRDIRPEKVMGYQTLQKPDHAGFI